MNTGIETWNMNLLEIGAMYPFPGTEVFWTIVGLATWILFHLIQIKNENAVYKEDEELFEKPEKLKAAMAVSNAETLLESMKSHGDGLK